MSQNTQSNQSKVGKKLIKYLFTGYIMYWSFLFIDMKNYDMKCDSKKFYYGCVYHISKSDDMMKYYDTTVGDGNFSNLSTMNYHFEYNYLKYKSKEYDELHGSSYQCQNHFDNFVKMKVMDCFKYYDDQKNNVSVFKYEINMCNKHLNYIRTCYLDVRQMEVIANKQFDICYLDEDPSTYYLEYKYYVNKKQNKHNSILFKYIGCIIGIYILFSFNIPLDKLIAGTFKLFLMAFAILIFHMYVFFENRFDIICGKF